jgi:pimeloyl-ACP methyl ester carboxylesterase
MRRFAVRVRCEYRLRCMAGVLVGGLIVGASAAVASVSAGVSCRIVSGIPVALAPGDPPSSSVSGELCARPGELRRGATIQVLIHGASYNHDYWDFGRIDGISYSYARAVAAAGFPTFALDEIGAGASFHPPSALVTLPTAAYIAHEVVGGLRNGTITGTRFGKVIEVGHSFGSAVTWEEAITYHDVDGVIVTAAAHFLTALASQALAQDFYPAVDDPRFTESGLDPGYLTTLPGTRAGLFYAPGDSAPAVIAADEARKDVFSSGMIAGALVLDSSMATREIDVPVLVVIGSDDALACGAGAQGETFDCSSGRVIAQQESPYYSPQARLRACAVPGAGHDINLAVNHVLEEADTVAWSSRYIGQTTYGTIKFHNLAPGCS